MKKYFIFAAIAAAGLLASCSSSDDAISEGPGNPIGNQEEPQEIILGATARANVTTRGTGTVGDIAGTNTNVWAGEHVNVYMFNKGSFYLAGAYEAVKGEGDNVSYNATNDPALFENQEMRTPNPGVYDGADVKEYVLASITEDPGDKTYIQHKYYPMTNNFDFWAYRIDDAFPGTATAPAPVYYVDDNTSYAAPTKEQIATVKEIRVPFEIDGTQDLLVASAWPDAADVAKLGTRATDFYSSYAARQGVQPNLTFQHLLTRLEFYIKGGDLESCGWEDSDADDVLDRAHSDGVYKGVFVKGIKVYSRKDGKLIAAHDYWTGGATSQPSNDVSKLIKWDCDYTGTPASYAAAYAAAIDPQTQGTDVVPFTLMGKKDATASIAYEWAAATNEEVTAAGTNYIQTHSGDASTAHNDLLVAANKDKIYEFSDGNMKLVTVNPATPGTLGQLPALYAAADFADNDAFVDALTITAGTPDANYGKVYKCTATAGATPADATIDEVSVGAPMMVSTEAAGYYMEITLAQYLLDKSHTDVVEPGDVASTADHYELKESTLTKFIPATNLANHAFEQSTSYKVVITCFGYQEINVKATLTGWTDGGKVNFDLD